MLPQKSAAHKLQRISRRHGECFQYDKDQIALINSGMANIEDCDPFPIQSNVNINEFKDCEIEGITYTTSNWLRSIA